MPSTPATSRSAEPPRAYQTGHQDFYGRDFLVTPDVLIPRPESEQIIDLILTLAGKPYLPGVKAPARVLPEHPIIIDVGTGSGCLAITIKKELPEATVYATDISEPALKVAQKNARRHTTPINFIISHLCQKVNSLTKLNYCPRGGASENTTSCVFTRTSSAVNPATDTPVIPDVIVANLPYVDEDWPWLDKSALSHEPSTALYAKDHGLALIKELIDTTHAHHLILEADPCQHRAIIDYATKKGLAHRETRGYILYFSE